MSTIRQSVCRQFVRLEFYCEYLALLRIYATLRMVRLQLNYLRRLSDGLMEESDAIRSARAAPERIPERIQ